MKGTPETPPSNKETGDPLDRVSKETKRSIARCIQSKYITTDESKKWRPRELKIWETKDSDPPPEPVEKMREKLGKTKLPPVDRKAKETEKDEPESGSEPPPLDDDDLPVFGCGMIEKDKEEEDDDEPPPES